MKLHRLEKIWLIFGITMLGVFLLILGVQAFAMGMHPPGSEGHQSIDPTKVSETPPFDNPSLRQIGENEYEAVMVAYAFGYSPADMEIPVGATVHFTVTSSDVIHGFQIPGTNVNMMVMPGEISRISHTFDEPGEYLLLCNEYCGAAHEFMSTRIIVK
jgi:cytochrome c oxidase subunit 2